MGNTGSAKFEIDNRYIFGKHLSLLGSSMGTHQDFLEVMTLVFSGKLRPVLDRDYPLAEAAAAHTRLQSGEQLGGLMEGATLLKCSEFARAIVAHM